MAIKVREAKQIVYIDILEFLDGLDYENKKINKVKETVRTLIANKVNMYSSQQPESENS